MARQDQASTNEPLIKTLYSVMNSILHIIESVLSQEELPDFYEENLPTITNVCMFILSQDYPKFQKVPQEIIKARGKVVLELGGNGHRDKKCPCVSLWA